MAVANANDAVSMISTADGALIEVQNMLQRMRELALQSATGTNAAQDRSYIDTEFQQLHAEVTRIANNTQWNGRNILDGSAGGAAGKSSVKFMVSHHVTRTDIGTTTGEAVNHDDIIGFTPAEITSAGQWSGTGTATGVPPTTGQELVVHNEVIGKTQSEVAAAGKWSGTGTATGDAKTTTGEAVVHNQVIGKTRRK